MSLVKYREKREFSKTGEPEGKEKPAAGSVYAIQKHDASHLHWDLRLEFDGVLKSWAIPKEPPTMEGEKRLAVQTEDHPVEYAKFQGEIPKGEYGAGSVEIWDSGTFRTIERTEEKLLVDIKGKKLTGPYYLVRFPNAGPKSWLFFKKKAQS
ncbi:MAG: DNA polymerase ligase N-terminal domain-containing protein [Candidatus Altiarchaeota archaeon]|nr:DNA polymerase ligase N-terminal domain-containing protein [Candidatus Altiarchaeota archaeon]